MGVPFGLLFADCNVAHEKKNILANMPCQDKPQTHCCYVDDTFLYINNFRTIEKLKKKLLVTPSSNLGTRISYMNN